MSVRILLIFGLLAAGLELEAQTATKRSLPAGVLVGIQRPGRHDELEPGPPTPATLRTVWLDTGGTATRALPRLLVPRSSGFWWLGLTSTCSEQPHDLIGADIEIDINDALWASPIDRPMPEAPAAAWDCRSTKVDCATEDETYLHWVWPDFVSMERGGESTCGLRRGDSFEPAVHRLDDLEAPLTVATVLGAPAEARLRGAYDREKLEYRSRHHNDSCGDPDDFSPASWRIVRDEGRWLLDGLAYTNRNCELGIVYSADADVSRVTGSTALQRPPSTSAASMKDAFPSVDERWLLLVGEDEIVLAPRQTPDQPIAKALLSMGDHVVMVEWAVGRNVARWRDQVRKLSEP